MTEKTDEQLIKQYGNGDNSAFEVLYARYKKQIYHYCYRQVSSPASADELHQEIWLKVIKSTQQFKQQSSFKTWLYRIAHNALVDYYRHSAQRSRLKIIPETTADGAQESASTMVQEQSGMDSDLYNKQLQAILLEGLENLPEEQKEVFLLHEKSGLSLDDIAAVTQSSFESTKSRLRYAIRKLRQHLAHHLGVQL